MKLSKAIPVSILGFINLLGLVYGSASALVKCPDFYKDLYLESEILGKFQKLFNEGNSPQIDKT